MSQQVDTNTKGFKVDAAIGANLRVKLTANANEVTVAGLADKDIGVTQNETFAAGERVNVKFRTAAGTHKVIASEALAIGATLYTEASGKVQDTAQATAFQWGTALEAAAADGDIIEALANSHGDTAAV